MSPRTGRFLSVDSEKIAETKLNVELNIPIREKMEHPSVIDPTETIKLTFNEKLDNNTVSEGIKLYKIGSDGKELEIDIITDTEQADNTAQDPSSTLNIKISGEERFVEGEEYKLLINKELKSSNGKSLEDELINYFSVNYTFKLDSEGISELNNDRTSIVCISDLHLGANKNYAELNNNTDTLIKFLNQIRVSPNIKELVIAGDLIDEWFIPMELDSFNGKTQLDFVKAVATTNNGIIDAFNQIIQDGNIKVTYVPGNHDILISSEDIETIMPGISQARDIRGLGAYTPLDLPELIIEHGHRYNFFCAPEYSNQSLTQTDSILPPGYFFTRMATSSVIQGRIQKDSEIPIIPKDMVKTDQYLTFLYWNIWKELITQFPVEEGLDEPVIKTGLDGYTSNYAINDFLPSLNPEDNRINTNLYTGITETWNERQTKNLVPTPIPIEEAILKAAAASHLDDQSSLQYFNNPDSNKRIVIFGHSHEARVITSFKENDEGDGIDQKNVYVNSGTWIDKNSCTRTFVVITPPKNEDSTPSFVSLYQYSPEGEIKRLDTEAITDLKQIKQDK